MSRKEKGEVCQCTTHHPRRGRATLLRGRPAPPPERSSSDPSWSPSAPAAASPTASVGSTAYMAGVEENWLPSASRARRPSQILSRRLGPRVLRSCWQNWMASHRSRRGTLTHGTRRLTIRSRDRTARAGATVALVRTLMPVGLP